MNRVIAMCTLLAACATPRTIDRPFEVKVPTLIKCPSGGVPEAGERPKNYQPAGDIEDKAREIWAALTEWIAYGKSVEAERNSLRLHEKTCKGE
jgi:RecB family exonuclease